MGKKIVFYEKSGCMGNKRQKDLLRSYGIEFEVKDLLNTHWNKEVLDEFFKALHVEQMINPFAPKVKHKEIVVKDISKDELIDLMLKEPILIKRPLIEIDNYKICGFDIDKINKILNISIDINKDISTCQSSDKCISV